MEGWAALLFGAHLNISILIMMKKKTLVNDKGRLLCGFYDK